MYDATVTARFWAKVAKGDGCWTWIAAKTGHGYGVFWVPAESRTVMAHRVAYALEYGAVPDGLHIDHLCRTRACVRPTHLEAVTNRENILRGEGATAVHARKTHCPHGHPYDGPLAYIDGDGRRRCGVCRPKPTVPAPQNRTHCIHGHEFTPENTYRKSNGGRGCRTCRIELKRRRRAEGRRT